MSTLVLDTTTKTIKVVMSGAAATTNPDFTASYADNNGTTFTEAASDGALTGGTDATVVAAPASGYRRVIKKIFIENKDTAAVTITVKYDNNGTQRNIVKVTLQVGDTWSTDGTYDTNGSLKQTLGTVNLSSVTGTLPVANGGTNLTAFTANGVVYASSTSALATGSVLTFDGTNLATTGQFSTSSTFGFKNRIINGNMVIDQRNAGASQTFTAAAALAYAVDRWYGYCTGANVTGQQVAGATTPTVTQNRYRFTGAASVTAVGFGQRIEQKNSYDLAGSTCTLSADLAISATLTTVTWTAYYATTTADTFGTLASPTVTSIATGTFTVTSTVTNFSANISVPAAATTGLQILFTVGALTAGLTWTIGNVQLEKSSVATSFDTRSYGTVMVLCQRYFEKSYDTATAVGTATNTGLVQARNAGGSQLGSGYLQVSFAAEKRTTPSITRYSPNTGASGNVYLTNPAGDGNYTPIAYISTRNFSYGTTSNILNADAFVQMQWAASAEL